jgi:hypothetical protein
VPTDIKILAFIAIGLMVLFIFIAGQVIVKAMQDRKLKEAITPMTEEGLTQFDELPPGLAVTLAWSEPGDFPRWHQKMQDEVRQQMPVLARALDRMVESDS